MIGNSNDEINFPKELSLIDRQVANLRKTFADNAYTNIKLSKLNYLRFVGRILGRLMKVGLPLMKNAFTSFAKNNLIQLGLAAPVSVTDAGIHFSLLPNSKFKDGEFVISFDEHKKLTGNLCM